MKNRLLSIFALLALLTIGACSDDETGKVITDADGITITLTWITDGTAPQAIEDVDLDLRAVGPETESSTYTDAFEDLELTGDNLDGEYIVRINVYANYAVKDVDYVVTISGGGKDYEFDGTFASDAEDEEETQDLLTVTKAGNKYTIND